MGIPAGSSGSGKGSRCANPQQDVPPRGAPAGQGSDAAPSDILLEVKDPPGTRPDIVRFVARVSENFPAVPAAE